MLLRPSPLLSILVIVPLGLFPITLASEEGPLLRYAEDNIRPDKLNSVECDAP